MASFLCDLVKTYVEKLIDGAIAEARHVFCFTCIVKQFEEERASLEPERITIEQRVKVAKERDKDIQANVGSWAEEIDKLDQVGTKSKQTCFFGFCPDCIWRYKTGKELAYNLEKIKRLIEKGEKLENIELPRRLPDVERYSSKDYIAFKSREAKYKELLDALKDDNNYITGLQGMGGTGKTTLAKEVGKELKKSEQFAHVVDTTVSFTPDIKKIQDEIAGPLGLELADCNESDRPKKLWSRLTNGDKILVILDDVWDRGRRLDFEAIGIPKRDNHKGCRVLVTSRSKLTFNIMDCDKTIELGLLSTEDAWIMFEWYAGISNSSSKILINKARKIAKECKQLPVAISVIASSLKGQQNREHEWDVTLKSLKQPISMHGVDDDMVGIYNCLKISYDNLKDEKAKGLFLLCSVFREDEESSIEILTRLCIGVGLLGEDYGSYDDARNQVVVAKNKLVDSCLLLEVSTKRLRMHDLVRDAAQWIANKEIQCVKLFDKEQKSLVENQTNIKYLLCEGKCMDFFNLKFDGSKLETLIVKADRDEDCKCIEVPNSFFENVIKLRVLYFSNNYDRTFSFPPSIQLLTNIRSMLVDNVDLGDISILGKLLSLETLDLDRCKINELPNQIAELKKFKLLKLKRCKIRMNNPFEVIKRCSSLEELYFGYSFNMFCEEITLPELQRYHIHADINYFSSWVLRTKFPKSVVFRGDEKRQLSEGTLKYCMQTAEGLCLQEIKGKWRNLMPDIVELGMNDIVELYLRDMPQLRCLVDTIGSQVPNVLSKLVVLHLELLINLEELFNGPISLEFLKNLEKLSIESCFLLTSLSKCKLNLSNLKKIIVSECHMLVSLFEVSTSQSLVLLEKLEINDCRGLKTIIADERREDEEIDDSGNSKSHGSMFSTLKVIVIKKCHRLESILPSLSAQDLQILETIRIRECKGLKYVFGQSQHVELVSLSELELSELPKFIGIFEECYDPMSSCVKGSSSTSKAQTQLDPIKCNAFSWWTHICCQTTIPLVDVDGDQPHDYSVASESNSYRLNIWERVQCLPIKSKILCNIKEIKLNCLPKMKSVIILSFVPIMLLETLEIRNCNELQHIIIDIGDHNTGGNNSVNVFPKLKKLHVGYCSQLKYIFGHENNDHQNHMEVHLHFLELRQLELWGLPSLVAMCPKQYRTTFPSLKSLELRKCSQVDIKSIGDFNIHSVSESLDNTIIKELSGNVKHFLTLEILEVFNNSKLENIFSVNEIDGQKLDLGLQAIKLCDLPMMTCLFVGPKNSIALINLTDIKLKQCGKLKIAFSTSILRFLPELLYLTIDECNELEHIIEDDFEKKKNSNYLSSRTCFPKLEELVVIKCNKLKSVLPFSVCKELPKLDVLLIIKADELEEIFKSKDDQKVDIPNLNVLVFGMLPSLRHAQGNQFQTVENRLVWNCDKKLTLTSAPATKSDIFQCVKRDRDLFWTVRDLFKSETTKDVENDGIEQLPSSETTEDFESDLASVENDGIEQLPNAETTEYFELPSIENVPSLTIIPTNSEVSNLWAISINLYSEVLSERSMDQQHSPGKTDTIVKPSQVNNLKGSTSEKTPFATLSTISGTKNEPSIPVVTSKQKGIGIEGTSKTNNDQVSLDDDAFMKVNSNGEKEFSKSDEIIVSKSKPSSSITSPIAFMFLSTPSKGYPSKKVEDLEILPTNSELEGSTSKRTTVATLSTISETNNEPIQVVASKQKGIEVEGTSKTNNDQGIEVEGTSKTNNDQVSLNDDAFMKVNSNVEEQFSKDDEIIVSKTKPSPSITSPIASQFPSMPSKGDLSKKVEDLSYSLFVKRDLEELISKNHLNYENLSLLTEFLVKNPSVRLKETSLPNRYKGCAYNLLAELLKFLETHSLLEVSSSCHSEFVELLQDARYFAFDKEWLDGVERRALFPEIQVSPDALEKLLDSKKRVTKDVEDLRLKIDVLSQVAEDLKLRLTSSEAVLQSIIQQEAVLSAPIGY